jgi:serine protease Do
MAGRFIAIIALCLAATLPPPAVASEKRVALVIGNSAYRNTVALPNPKNDAEDMAAALRQLGFETVVGIDLDKRGMDDAFRRFARAAREADTALFYYAGHGMQFAGTNYLMPIDARLADEADLPYEMAKIDDIVADLQRAKNVRIVILDACRDNPLAEKLRSALPASRSAAISRGLARIDRAQGMVVAYATQPGRTAADGTGRNSPFSRSILKHIATPGVEIGPLFRRIAIDVNKETKGDQLPELSVSLLGEFYMKPEAPVAEKPAPAIAAAPPGVAPPRATGDISINDLVNSVGDGIVTVIAKASAGAAATGDSAKKPAAIVPAPHTVGDTKPGDGQNAAESKRVTHHGSGFVIDASGLIVTTNSSIDKADDISVSFRDGTTAKAEVVGRDHLSDLALLKVTPHKALTAIELGSSDELLIGNRVAVVGNSLGLGWTVTSGMVAGLHRELSAGPYDDFIQSDAGTTKGYAGAPLLTIDGKARGIVALVTADGGRSGSYSFAIPANFARPIIEQLRQFGEVRRAWFGVRIQAVTKEIADGLGIGMAGALVAGVDDKGPSKAAGIEPGDVVVRFDGREVKTMRDLPRIVAMTPIGKQVEVVVLRKGREERKTVSLGRLETAARTEPAAAQGAGQQSETSDAAKAMGLDIANLSDELRTKYKIAGKVKGVIVTAVEQSSVAKGRVEAGDVIVEVAQATVTTVRDVQSQLDALKKQGRKAALLRIESKGSQRFVALSLQ